MDNSRIRGLAAAAVTVTAVAGLALVPSAAAAPTDVPAPTPTVDGHRRVPRAAWFVIALTDVQRQCLADQGLQRAEGRLNEDQREALRTDVDAALASCSITVPRRLLDRERLGFGYAALTAEQQQCLADIHLSRPVGRLTPEQRALLRANLEAAVKDCGIAFR